MINIFVFMILALPLISFADSLTPDCSGTTCGYADFMELIKRVISFAIKVGVAFSAIVFAYAGWLYMTSGGDEGKVKQATEMLTKLLWGFLFALGAFLIVQLLSKQLGYTNI